MRRFLRKRLLRRLETPPDSDRRGRRLAKGVGLALLGFFGLRRVRRRVAERAAARPTPEEIRASRRIALLLLLAFGAAVGLLVIYALGGQPQIEGTLLGIALGGMGFAFILWGKHLFPAEIVTEEREPHPSEALERRAAEETIVQSREAVTRRTFLLRLLLGALGAFGVAMAFPVASLGPDPIAELRRTAWRKGLRLVDENNVPVRSEDLELGSVVTVFPEGHTDREDSQAILVKVPEDLLDLPSDRKGWAPGGSVCYSKLCTHAGCPVGLYVQEIHELQCPCHQSAFDVLNGAEVLFGPAPRPLPQLQLYVDANGYLRAGGDFPEPVGPGFWNMDLE